MTLCIVAANREPAQFAAPDRLDITISHSVSASINGAGAHVARLKGSIAIALFPARLLSNRLDCRRTRGRRARLRIRQTVPVATR